MDWRTDRLYQLVFQEIRDNWVSIHQHDEKFGPLPDLLRIQECGAVKWKHVFCLPPILHEWILEGDELTEQPTTDALYPDNGGTRGAFFAKALVQFHITPDRKRIAMNLFFGPRYGRGYVLRPLRQGDQINLTHDKAGWMA